MDLLENTRKAHENHTEAKKDMRREMDDVRPSNVAPVLARQAVTRDHQLSLLTMSCWVRASDHDMSDIPNN
jgi:hypothetical protein